MIKHVLMWKLKAPAAGHDNSDNTVTATRALYALKDQIPVIRRIEVGKNFARVDNAYDLVVTVEFDTLEDFRTFLDHPAHIQIGEDAKRYKDHSIVVDYEI